MIDLHDDNVLLYAVKCYDKPGAIMSEFESDFKRFKYVKRLINKYRINRDIKERLILNHIIILANVFGVEATVRILMLKLCPDDYPVIKTFLLYLNYMPKFVQNIEGKTIISSDIPLDWSLVEVLRNITKDEG
jgi:hypothetical protein